MLVHPGLNLLEPFGIVEVAEFASDDGDAASHVFRPSLLNVADDEELDLVTRNKLSHPIWSSLLSNTCDQRTA